MSEISPTAQISDAPPQDTIAPPKSKGSPMRFRLVFFSLLCGIATCIYILTLWQRGEIVLQSAVGRTLSAEHSVVFVRPVYPQIQNPTHITVYIRSQDGLPVAEVPVVLQSSRDIKISPRQKNTDTEGMAQFRVEPPGDTAPLESIDIQAIAAGKKLPQKIRLRWHR